MIYEYTREEVYGWPLFYFMHGPQEINVVFVPLNKEDSYLVSVFAENAEKINDYHNQDFSETLDAITVEFPNGRDLFIEGAIIG
ncbi:MAG: hypothetical protein AAF600_13120 [Bacteroidota bacterium]